MSRTESKRLRLSDEEYAIIKANADGLGMKVAPYIRKVAQNPMIIKFNYSAIERHTKQIGKIVNSVNQLIFTIEVTNNYQPKEIDGIMDYVEQILETERELLREVRKQWERSVRCDKRK